MLMFTFSGPSWLPQNNKYRNWSTLFADMNTRTPTYTHMHVSHRWTAANHLTNWIATNCYLICVIKYLFEPGTVSLLTTWNFDVVCLSQDLMNQVNYILPHNYLTRESLSWMTQLDFMFLVVLHIRPIWILN